MSKRVETHEDAAKPTRLKSAGPAKVGYWPSEDPAQIDEATLAAAPGAVLLSHPFSAWAPIVTLGIVDWILADHDKLAFAGWTSVIIAVAFLALISSFYGITGRSRRLAQSAHYAALWLGFSAVGVVFTYLMADMRMPLLDARLARMDAALGFDWPAWFEFVRAHWLLKGFLEAAYSSLLPQIIFSIIYLSHVGRPGRNHELLWAAFISLVVTSVVSGLLPALGPKVYFRGLRPAYLMDVLALRGGTASTFVLGRMQGIVTMPSFHAALAVLFVYAHRPPVRSFVFLAPLNALMMVSIVSEGGHYLIDLIAGAAIALLAVAIVRPTMSRLDFPMQDSQPANDAAPKGRVTARADADTDVEGARL